jgi:hypothetical protein
VSSFTPRAWKSQPVLEPEHRPEPPVEPGATGQAQLFSFWDGGPSDPVAPIGLQYAAGATGDAHDAPAG